MKNNRYTRYLEILQSVNNTNIEHEEVVLLVDGLNLYIRSFAVVPTVNKYGLHTGGLYGSLQSIKYAINILNPTRVIVIFDGRGGSSNRREYYPEYKAGRRGLKGLNRTFKWLSEEEEEKSCIAQLNRFIEYLQCLPIQIIRVDGIEADDAIAYICTDIYKNGRKVIMSTDKDYFQLVREEKEHNDKVSIWSPTRKIVITENYILKEYGIHPINFILYRAVEGDSSDNIPGIKGIGLKTFRKFFSEMLVENIKYSPEDIIRICEKYKDINRVYKIIYENKDKYLTNYRLMQLYDVEIAGNAKAQLIDFINNKKIPPLNQTNLRKMLLEDKLYSQIKNFGNWYIAYQNLNCYAIGYNKKLKDR